VIRVFSALWSGADALRKVLHLLVLLFIFSIILGVLSSGAPGLPDKAALLIQPTGTLVEQLEGDPFDRALAEALDDVTPQTLVQDIIDGLSYAKDDRRIKAVVLDLRGLAGGGMSKLQRIGDALAEFEASGKPVIAYGDYFTQASYYLASRASDVYMHPDGMLLLRGFGSYQNYYKDAIDKLKIDWNVFRVGTHKSAVEPFMRNDMSEEDRSSRTRLLDQLWTAYGSDIESARSLAAGSVTGFVDDFLASAERSDATLAEIAVERGFVDRLVTHDELKQLVAEYAGEDEDSELGYQSAALPVYLAQMRLMKKAAADDQSVAVIVAAGEILDGSQPPGTIGGESTARLLARARHDDKVRAVVLRVDSPGGSAFASELIRNEILALEDAGKPVVASMSSVAASGGYWISMAADRIIAKETTITGSIGIFGMFPTFQRSLETLGIHTDGVGTTRLSDALRPDLAMSEEARDIFQALINDGYEEFITRVAEHRNMDKAAVDRIAQGQVWTGRTAVDIGLVDQLGDFEDAVTSAAELAGLAEGEYDRVFYEEELSPAEKMMLQFLHGARALGVELHTRSSSVERLAGMLESRLSPLLRFNDPQGLYAHCFCRIE